MTGPPDPVPPSLAARPATGAAAGASHLTFWVLVSVACLAVAYALLFSPILGLCGFAAVSALAAAQSLLWGGRRRLAIVLILVASPAVAAFGLEIGRGRGDAAVQMEMVLLGLAATAVLVEAPIVGVAGFALVVGAIVGHLASGRSWSQEVALGGLAFAVGVGLMVVVARVRDRGRQTRLRVERDLAQSHARYRSLVENQVELVCRMTPAGRLTFVNGAFCRLFGLAEADLVGRDFAELVQPEARFSVAARLSAVATPGAGVDREHPVRVSDGRSRWVRWVDTPVRGEHGAILEIQSLGWDVTDLRAVTQRLQSGHERLLRQQQRLVGLSEVLEELPLEAFLAQLVLEGAEELAADCAQVCDLPSEGDALRLRASSCADGSQAVASAAARIEQRLNRFAPLSSGEFAELADGRWADIRDEDGLVAAANERVSFLASPFLVGSERGGFLVFQSTDLARRWSPEDRMFALSLAGMVTLARERDRRVRSDELLEDRTHYLTALTELLPRILEPFATNDLLQEIVESGARLVGSEDGYLGLVEGDSMVPRVGTGVLHEFEGVGFERGRGVGGRVWDSGRPEVVHSYSDWEGRDEDKSRLGIQAVLCVPLTLNGQVEGVLGVVSRRVGKRFGEVETAILERFADLAALALERARLIEDLSRELSERQAAAEEVRRLNGLLEARVAARTQELGRVSGDLETSQSRMRTILERSARDWQATFDAVEDVVLLAEAGGSLLRCNRAAQERAGLPFDSIVGASLADLPREQPWLAFAQVAPDALESMSNRSLIVRGSDGFSWDVSASPLTTGEGRRVVLIARDVSPLQALQESLRKAETFSAIGTLVAGVAHEVRNPLFAMSANLDAFEEEVRGDDVISTYVGNLRLEMRRLERLMMGLLEYAQPQGAAFAVCDLNAIVAGAVRACRARSEATRVTIDFGPGVPVGPVAADSDQLTQVIQNLLDNALQHSPPGSRVRIRLERRGAPGLPRSAVVISDSGPGLREQDIPRLVEPFFTRRRGGIGLGLSIAQRIVEQHRGSIWARNRPEGGAEFCVELPAVQD